MGDGAHSNDIEGLVTRDRKRKLKEEVKVARERLKHRIKFSNPGPLLDEVMHLYTPGMTSKQIDQARESRNKYSHAPHIGRLLP